LVAVSGVEGSVIVAIDPHNGNQDRCQLCRGSFWKMFGEVVKGVEGYS
jgi:hypothetical protein